MYTLGTNIHIFWYKITDGLWEGDSNRFVFYEPLSDFRDFKDFIWFYMSWHNKCVTPYVLFSIQQCHLFCHKHPIIIKHPLHYFRESIYGRDSSSRFDPHIIFGETKKKKFGYEWMDSWIRPLSHHHPPLESESTFWINSHVYQNF